MTAPINQWTIPWRIAAALALESGLDWARWAYGLTAPPAAWPANTCKQGEACQGCCECLRPVLDPSDVEAYRTDCARRGVEPGPMPALEYGTDESPVYWVVETLRGTKFRPDPVVYTRVRVGTVEAHHNGRCWAGLYVRSMTGIETSNMIYLGRFMQAVDAATAAARAMGVG